MQVHSTMNISNLLNSDPEPTDAKVETSPSLRLSNEFTCVNPTTYTCKPEQSENNYREIYSIPSSAASVCSPKQSHQKVELSYPSPAVQQLYTPPIEKAGLAFRPRQGSDQSQGSYSGYQSQQSHQYHENLPGIGRLYIQLDLRSPENRSLAYYSPHHQANRHRSYEIYPRLEYSQRDLKPHGTSSRHHHSSRERPSSSREIVRKANARRPPKKKNSPHSNSKYQKEHIHYIRYFKIDHNLSYALIQVSFDKRFPEEKRDTDQCFSSRTYRNHVIPVLGPDGGLTFNNHGKVIVRDSKIRKRDTPEFKNVPFDLVSRLPHRALEYSWVTDEHKRKALEIIEQDERDLANGCLSEAGKWRRVIALMEEYQSK